MTRWRRHRVISPTVLTGRRRDPAAGRTRTVDRLRARPAGVFPGPQRALHPTDPTPSAGTGPFTLLTGCQPPAAIRRARARRPETRLRHRHAVRTEPPCRAGRRHTGLPGQEPAAGLGRATGARLREDHTFDVITGLFGPEVTLGAAPPRPSHRPRRRCRPSHRLRHYRASHRPRHRRLGGAASVRWWVAPAGRA
ncbi:hypothetical protein ABT124_49730 [Streptomyces sp. NPDC001982]|uniref:hypothetical protein n=1 Tax=Streptomyces sp. NPDC001982 TaxID=3154405 RepID=UPI00331BB11A